MLHNRSCRSATITCLTPAHVIKISKEYFLKYMSGGGSDMNITVGQQDRLRNRERALARLSLVKNLEEREFSRGAELFSYGEKGRALYIVDTGEVEIRGDTGKLIKRVQRRGITGEHSLITGLPRNTTATCVSDKCMAREMMARDFFSVYNSSPLLKQSLNEICFQRDFRKAFAKKFGRNFSGSVDHLREAFDSMDVAKTGEITPDDVRVLLKSIYPSLADDDPLFYEAFQSLDIDGNNSIEWNEFKKIFLTE